MRLKLFPAILYFALNVAHGQTIYQKDFDYYWQTINDNFAYFHKQHADWNKVKTIYQPAVDTVTTRDSFIHLLEAVNNELYNGHIFLNVNTNSSSRTIPTGADLKVSRRGNQFVISEIREGYNADLCGLKPGMVITKFNGVPVDEAIKKFLPKSVESFDTVMMDYAANLLLAGTHDTQREITARVNNQEQTFKPDHIRNKTEEPAETLIETRILGRSYRIH